MLLKETVALYKTLISIKEKEMPIRISYKFSKLLSKIEEEQTYYQETFRKILLKYAQKDEKNNLIPDENGNIQIQIEKIEDANRELKELDEIEIKDIPNISFTLDELENLSFKPIDVQNLLTFIKETE